MPRRVRVGALQRPGPRRRSAMPALAELQPLARAMARIPGVVQVGAPRLNADRRAAQLPVALRYDSATERAMRCAGGPLPDAAHAAAPRGTQAIVAGTAAVIADVGDSVQHDLRLIFPVAAGLILLIVIALPSNDQPARAAALFPLPTTTGSHGVFGSSGTRVHDALLTAASAVQELRGITSVSAGRPRFIPFLRIRCDTPERTRSRSYRACGRWRDPDSNRGHHDFQSCGPERDAAPSPWKTGSLFQIGASRIDPQFAIFSTCFRR